MSPDKYFSIVGRWITALLMVSFAISLALGGWQQAEIWPEADEQDTGRIVTAQAAVDGLFGNIILRSERGLCLDYAYVLINGVRCGNLRYGELTVRVSPGDIVSIDGTAYQRQLKFSLEIVSSSIDSDYLSDIIVTCGEVVTAGVAVFK